MGWAFLTRAGSEGDLLDELRGEGTPRQIAEGVVLALSRPRKKDGHHGELTFARQAMRVAGRHAADVDVLAKVLVDRLTERGETEPFHLQIVAPDSRDPKDRRKQLHSRLGERLPVAIEALLPPALKTAKRSSPTDAARLLQVWILDDTEVLYGLTPVTAALSPYPGGKLRLRRPEDALSRSGLKLEEAIAWVGLGPEKGDLCVDLGAAPGGWSQVALGRGAAVIAVDPAVVRIEPSKKKFTHLKESAFTFAPPEAMDWLLCDMAWRPLEVAQLLAKWARRGWARQLIANFKLPMKQKSMILDEIIGVLKSAGWEGVRARQLYHDRDEITVFAWLNAGIVARGWQPAFELKAHRNKPKDGERDRGPRPKHDARSQAGKKAWAAPSEEKIVHRPRNNRSPHKKPRPKDPRASAGKKAWVPSADARSEGKRAAPRGGGPRKGGRPGPRDDRRPSPRRR